MGIDLSGLKRIKDAKPAMLNAIRAACEEYANGGFRAEPIVKRHFTAGNQGRYGWKALSPDYAEWKAEGSTKMKGGVGFLNEKARDGLKALRKGLRRNKIKGAAAKQAQDDYINKARNFRRASKADKAGAGGLPMLVLTGSLRDNITAGRALIRQTGPSSFLITWANIPTYAIYHHEGTGKMAKRSPIEPNDEDRKAVIDAARRHLRAALGMLGKVQVGGAPGAVPRG